jgi:uncharacterized protein with HEPN domain
VIARTRDRLIHGYFKTDHDYIWQIVTDDIPVLIIELQHILAGA